MATSRKKSNFNQFQRDALQKRDFKLQHRGCEFCCEKIFPTTVKTAGFGIYKIFRERKVYLLTVTPFFGTMSERKEKETSIFERNEHGNEKVESFTL